MDNLQKSCKRKHFNKLDVFLIVLKLGTSCFLFFPFSLVVYFLIPILGLI